MITLSKIEVFIPRTVNERIQNLSKKFKCNQGDVIRASIKYFIDEATESEKEINIKLAKLIK